MTEQPETEQSAGGPLPCRLFVYLARDAPVGVVLRRGPSDWVRLSLWHTETDRFEHGHWMKARLYERRSDLSPDGSLFVGFVRRSGGPAASHDPATANRDTWVAISRPPWFTALALWFVGGTYCTGGFFPAADNLWLGFDPNPVDQGVLPPWLRAVTSVDGYIDRTANWTERTVWFNRLLRDGWERIEGAVPEQWRHLNRAGTSVLTMTLRSQSEFSVYGGPHIVEYTVRWEHGEEISLGRADWADWADWDQRARLILARDGQLTKWEPNGTLRSIIDFNGQTLETFPAPAWAVQWPEPRDRHR